MKRKIILAAVVVVLVAGGIWGVQTYKEIQKGKAERANTAGAQLVTTAPTQAPAPSATVPAGPMRTFVLGDKTLIKWTGYKKVGQHSGWFILFDGIGKMPGNNIEQATIELSIETESCETDNAILTGIMKDSRFFNCEKIPTSTFKSVSIVKAEGVDIYTVTGDLTLRDITKRISFPAKITVQDGVVKLDADFKVNRRWWDIVYESVGDSFLYDDVRIELKAEAKEKAS